jgi:NAD(P)-dependent dehydrogenase (short-subunit alcohol dehydrogenase family)
MELHLAGRRALVTGGSRGIGRGIVEALAAEGAEVLFCGRDRATGDALAEQMRRAGGRATFLVADVESEAGIEALAEAVMAGGRVDILVNNVGGAHDAEAGARAFTAIPPADWPQTFMKCLFNAVRLIDRLTPAMQESGWGRIINISSTAGLEPGSVPADYAAAKAALNTATVSLSTSLARTGVTANIVSPGPILTEALAAYIDFLAGQGGWPEQGEDRHARFIAEVMPLKTKRLGRPEDIGGVVAFLASPRADYVTGAHLRVDGGLSVAAI